MKKLFVIFVLIATIVHIEGGANVVEKSSGAQDMCSKGVDKAIRREYTTYVNVLTNIFNDYDKLTNNGVTISCQIDLRTVVLNFTKIMDRKIKSIVNDMNTALMEVEKLIPTEIDVIAAIREGDFCAARYQLLENGKLSLNELIPIVYEKNLTNAYQLVGFLNSLPDLDDTLLGYRILLDEMKKNKHLYSTVTTSMAHQVLNVFHKTSNQNENFIHIRENLPESLKSFPWNAMLLINNKKGNEYLLGHGTLYDTSRRGIFTYIPACTGVNCQWKLIPAFNGTYFNMKNNQWSEYLYAETDSFALDNQRRRVFTFTTKDETKEEGRWQLEPIEGSEYFKIKNLFWNEYMYVDSDSFKYVSDRNCRTLFTWRPGGCEEDGCKWKFTRV